MRIDDFLSSVGVIKRRTIAKELGQNGLIHVNDSKVKPAYQVKINDIIKIKGTHPKTVEVLQLPNSSVPKEKRDLYIKELE